MFMVKTNHLSSKKMADWSDAQTRILIDERRNRNEEYYDLGRNRNIFWESIVTRINEGRVQTSRDIIVKKNSGTLFGIIM